MCRAERGTAGQVTAVLGLSSACSLLLHLSKEPVIDPHPVSPLVGVSWLHLQAAPSAASQEDKTSLHCCCPRGPCPPSQEKLALLSICQGTGDPWWLWGSTQVSPPLFDVPTSHAAGEKRHPAHAGTEPRQPPGSLFPACQRSVAVCALSTDLHSVLPISRVFTQIVFPCLVYENARQDSTRGFA